MTDSRQLDREQRRGRPRQEPKPTLGSPPHPLLALQRQIGNVQTARLLAQRAVEDEEEELVQPKLEVGAEGGALSPGTSQRVNALRGAGSPLEADLRARMEQAFGTDFSAVRVHTGGDADALNRGVGARAFTSVSDVVLRGDQSPADPRLLAHELTHVVQQRGMAASSGSDLQVGAADDSYEHEADAVAAEITGDA
jgi:hypothetical protein